MATVVEVSANLPKGLIADGDIGKELLSKRVWPVARLRGENCGTVSAKLDHSPRLSRTNLVRKVVTTKQSSQRLQGALLMEGDNAEIVKTGEDPASDDDISPTAIKIWAVVAFLLSLPVSSIVGSHLDQGRGRAAGIAFSLMIGGVLVFRRDTRHLWFWISISALAIIHVVLIVFVSWTNRSFPAPALWPVGFADFAFICGFMKLVQKLMTRS